MSNKKSSKKEIPKGLVSLTAILLLLSSILATIFASENNITANVIKEASIDSSSTRISIIEVDDVKELNQLNEGWYQIRNGYVFYLETFDSYVLLYIKVMNPEQQNGLLVVDEDGDFIFDESVGGLIEKQTIQQKNEEQITQNQITGEVTGLEGISGFVFKVEYATLDLAISGYNKKEFVVGDRIKIGGQEYIVRGNIPRTASETQQPVLFKEGSNIGETLFGGRAAYLDQQQRVIITQTSIATALNLKVGICAGDICRPAEGSWILKSEYQPSKPDQLKPPTFDPNNADEFSRKMDEYIQNTVKIATAKKEENRAKPLIDAANAWRAKPTDEEAKRRFELELKKWNIHINTKDNPAALISYSVSNDQTERTLARDLIIQRRNEPSVKEALADALRRITTEDLESAQSIPNVAQLIELNRLFELEQRVSAFGAKIDFTTGQIIDKKGNKGWGLRADGAIDPNIQAPPTTPLQIRAQLDELKQRVRQALDQYLKQAVAEQGVEERDGKLFDRYGRELSLSLDVNTGQWTITNRQSPQTIKNQQGVTLTRTEFLLEIEGQRVSIYRDATGRVYNYKEELLTSGQVLQASKFGTIDTQIVYEIRNGQVDTNKPVSARIGNVIIPTQAYGELLGLLRAAGKEPKTEGSFAQTDPLIIKTEKGNIVAKAYGFENIGGISKGTTIESNFKDGEPLLIKRTSEDGTSVLREVREFKEFVKRNEQGDPLKDAEGKEVKERVVQTLSWIKTSTETIDGQKYNLITERTYETDKFGRQMLKRFTELSTDALTGEPLKLVINVGDEKLEAIVKKGKPQGDAQAVAKLGNLRKEYQIRKFFAELERVLTEFQGLGYYASLFFDEDSLLQWRENVDRIFATFYLGTEYWSSTICRTYLDGEGEGIAYAETPQGLAQVGAHVEATRTQPIKTENGTLFIYKITFTVRNGDYEKDPRAPAEMNVNVLLKGDRVVKVFKQEQNIKRGSVLRKSGRDAIVQESKALFSEVCLTFDKKPERWKLGGNELCNKVVESSGEPADLPAPATTSTIGGNATTEITDF
ncbi:hypothetical protein HYX02_04285 [Candidatus Woesearchaeota archaeon]|nr:hypothetical protein [Candidatus Woesearchaeota archaeon]